MLCYSNRLLSVNEAVLFNESTMTYLRVCFLTRPYFHFNFNVLLCSVILFGELNNRESTEKKPPSVPLLSLFCYNAL